MRSNSFVLGLHNYFNRATHVNLAFSRLAYEIGASMYNRLKPIGKYEHPNNTPPKANTLIKTLGITESMLETIK